MFFGVDAFPGGSTYQTPRDNSQAGSSYRIHACYHGEGLGMRRDLNKQICLLSNLSSRHMLWHSEINMADFWSKRWANSSEIGKLQIQIVVLNFHPVSRSTMHNLVRLFWKLYCEYISSLRLFSGSGSGLVSPTKRLPASHQSLNDLANLVTEMG